MVQKFLRGLPGAAQVGCETCLNSYWLVEVVESIGMPIRVGHALKLRLIAESRTKTDKVDARVIAELLRVNFFPAIAIPPVEIRNARELLRGRLRLARNTTQLKNRIHGILTRAGVDYTKKEALGPAAEAYLEGLALPAAPKYVILAYLEMMRDQQRRIVAMEKEIERQVHPNGAWTAIMDRLRTIPGVGYLSAMLLVLELWDIERFPDARHLASYVGMVPSVNQTGGKKPTRGGALTKQGNTHVRWVMVQDAWVAMRHDRRYRGLFDHFARRQGRARAIIPVARYLLSEVYEVWRDGITYEELVQRKEARRKIA